MSILETMSLSENCCRVMGQVPCSDAREPQECSEIEDWICSGDSPVGSGVGGGKLLNENTEFPRAVWDIVSIRFLGVRPWFGAVAISSKSLSIDVFTVLSA